MTKKNKRNFIRQTFPLQNSHTWTAPDGYKIFVADRGAVRFNIPQDWEIISLAPHVEMNDRKPPDDNARLSLSFWQFPMEIDWSGLPLEPLLINATGDPKPEEISRSPIHHSKRTDIEIVWREIRFIDPKEKRDAFSRALLGRGFGVQALITMDLWVDDAPKFQPMWDEVMRSLQLGQRIADPTKGEIHH